MISRKRASIQNATTALIAQLIIMVGQFAVQTIFIRTLGTQYLGANGLFGNLMTFLSFAELGIGSAFSFALYKPLAEHDHQTIRAIMDLFRKVYNTIGMLILAGGLVLSIFLDWFIRDSSSVPHIRVYFILYLLSTVVSYFFTYNRSLIIADQKTYIDAINRLIFSLFRYVGQIVCLLVFKSYWGYLVILILGNLLSNIVITQRSHKMYPYLKDQQQGDLKVDPKIIGEIKHNVVGTISSKIGFIVVTGTDNILISKFIGLTIVGLYSNYALILNSIISLLGQVFGAVIASFGNLGVTERDNKEKQIGLFNQFVYYNALIVFFIALVAYAFFPPFIKLWLGHGYQLPQSTLIIIILNFVFAQFRPSLYMINAYGLFWGYRIKSIVEAVVNFGLSLALVKFTSLGINGVLLGTIIGNVLVNSWWDPLILYRGAYETSMLKFYLKYWAYMITFGGLLAIEILVLNTLNLQISGILPVIAFGVVCSLIVGCILLIAFSKSTGQSEMFKLVRSMIKRKTNQSN